MDDKIFVIPDVHGKFSLLERLLLEAEVIDENGERLPGIMTVSVGDLGNAIEESLDGDSECLLAVPRWIDKLIMGNHEMGWVFGRGFGFNGYYEHPTVASLYRSYYRDGIVCPGVCMPEWNLLITHAGVAAKYGFTSAVQAFREIMEVWNLPPSQWEKSGVTPGEIPARYLMHGIGPARGGWDPVSSVFWRDWHHEPLEKSFSQICGHTPLSKHDFWQRQDGTFSLNIDASAKLGKHIEGVMLSDDDGKPGLEFVTYTHEKVVTP